MDRDEQRVERNRQALKDAGLDALVCTLPMNVLLLSGYWPVVGTSIAVFTTDGRVTVLAPEDELTLAHRGWADDVSSFRPGSLSQLLSLPDAVRAPLNRLMSALGLQNARIGFEQGPVSEPASYAAMNLYAARMDEFLKSILPRAALVPATDLLTRLRMTLTPREMSRLKRSCSIAAEAFNEGRRQLRAGMHETEAANAFRLRLSDPGEEFGSVVRADGYAFCMSGENSYRAFAAFQLSGPRQLQNSDLVLVHCNSYVDGLWTDITRTYCLGRSDERKRKILEAVAAARDAALGVIKPGVAAKAVDAAARQVLADHGFGEYFVHGLGHAVGFQAIDHNAPPRLHPASPDVLEEGMVFNVEPAVYIRDLGGVRHCDMVAVTASGYEVLTPFQTSLDELIIETRDGAAANATS